jgi:ribonuclease R
MLSKKIGDELDCVVTGLTNFGVFAQCRKFGIEGLIQMADLGPDLWKYNTRTYSILGQRSGTSIRLGQAMRVRILSVNVPARQLSLAPTEPLVSEPRRKTEKKSAGKSRKGRRDKRSKRRDTNRKKKRRSR